MLRINQVKKSHLFIAGALVVCGVVGGLWSYRTLKKADPAKATLASFDAGNIMSDEVMGNYNSMTEGQIWDFLHQHGNCNDRATYKANQYPSLKYHIKDGHFVCMADESFDGQTTSHIIWQAAQDYKINPQVLIVLLQKEQNLVKDSWPNDKQYRSATGFGCPDTAACDSQYFGFRNQVRQAANLFRQVLNGGWSNYPAYQTSFIYYNPNSGCGGRNVYIANRATSALYRYTPYIPNQAALNAGTGIGDGCSSYGNRNFYNYFTEWFGDSRQMAVSDVNIESGSYTVHANSPGTNSVIDVSGGMIGNNGSNIQLWSITGAFGQVWQITRLNSGLYTLSVANTDMFLDVFDAKTTPGANVQLHRGNGTCAQQWAIQRNGDGYRLVSACSGLSLDIADGIIRNGTNVQIYSNNSTIAQRWYLERTVQRGTYHVVTGNNEMLDISGNRLVPQTNVQIWPLTGAAGQAWYIHRGENGAYRLEIIGRQLSLDVADSLPYDGTNVQVYTNNEACAQKWNLEYADNSNFYISSSCSDKMLDVSGNRLVNGMNVQLWSQTGARGQKWQFWSL